MITNTASPLIGKFVAFTRIQVNSIIAAYGSLVIVTYLLDFVTYVAFNSYRIRPVWGSRGLAGWVTGIVPVAIQFGAIAGVFVFVLSLILRKNPPWWACSFIGFLIAVPFILIRVGPFDYGGELHNLGLTTFGIFFGMVYPVVDATVFPALRWIATTPIRRD